MAIERFRAIVMQGYETGDTSEVVRTFSAEFGRLSVMCRGLRRPTSRFAGVMQPLATVDISVVHRDGAEIATLREAAALVPRDALHGDLERMALAFLLAEAASESCDVAQPCGEMFDAVEAALDALDPRAPGSAATVAAHYLTRIVALAGYEPSLDESILRPWPADTPRPEAFLLDVSEAIIHAEPTGGPTREWPSFAGQGARVVALPPQAVRALYANTQTPTEELARLPRLDPSHAAQLIEGLVHVSEWHLGHALRSAGFWRSIVR